MIDWYESQHRASVKNVAGGRSGKSSAMAPPGVRHASFRYKTLRDSFKLRN